MSGERFDLIVALYALCSDYHSGQWSRGYRILSRIEKRYRPRNIPCSKQELLVKQGDWEMALLKYNELEQKFAETL